MAQCHEGYWKINGKNPFIKFRPQQSKALEYCVHILWYIFHVIKWSFLQHIIYHNILYHVWFIDEVLMVWWFNLSQVTGRMLRLIANFIVQSYHEAFEFKTLNMKLPFNLALQVCNIKLFTINLKLFCCAKQPILHLANTYTLLINMNQCDSILGILQISWTGQFLTGYLCQLTFFQS